MEGSTGVETRPGGWWFLGHGIETGSGWHLVRCTLSWTVVERGVAVVVWQAVILCGGMVEWCVVVERGAVVVGCVHVGWWVDDVFHWVHFGTLSLWWQWWSSITPPAIQKQRQINTRGKKVYLSRETQQKAQFFMATRGEEGIVSEKFTMLTLEAKEV